MDVVGKDALLARRGKTDSGFPEEAVPIPGMGVVLVRGLSRLEVIYIQSIKGVAAVERLTVHLGMIEPAMTADEVRQWQTVSVGGELDKVTAKIGELSGMLGGAGKAAYKSDGSESGTGVRVLPGAEAVDDGGSDAQGDAG